MFLAYGLNSEAPKSQVKNLSLKMDWQNNFDYLLAY